MAEIPIDDSIPMFEWFNGPMVGGVLGAHPHTPTFGSPQKEGRKARAPGGKGISGRAKELLDAHGLANASLTCGKPKGVVSRHR